MPRENRILTTHVGSLVRPKALVGELLSGNQMREGADAARDKALDPGVLSAAVAAVVKRQVEIGLDIINDGEYGKSSWSNYIINRISGFELRPNELRKTEWLGADAQRFPEYVAEAFPRAARGTPTQACVAPIVYQDYSLIRRDVANLKAAVSGTKVQDVFFTAVAPASTAYDGVNEYYKSDHDYVFAIAEALRQEYLEIHKAGFLLQVDDAVLANMYDALVRKSPEHYRKWAELRIEALNHALRGIPEDRVRYHVCFGSWHMPHTSDAPLERIIDLILKVRAGGYSIEAANCRHEHEWRVWETVKLPDGKTLVPGVITHHTVVVEHPQLVADRIVRFAKLVGRENVIAGTDCGFAQVDFIQRVHASIMWAKFESLVEGARIATKTLWPK